MKQFQHEDSSKWKVLICGFLLYYEKFVLALIIMNEAISACMFLKVETSYMQGFTVWATVLVPIKINKAISACMFLKVETSYRGVSPVGTWWHVETYTLQGQAVPCLWISEHAVQIDREQTGCEEGL